MGGIPMLASPSLAARNGPARVSNALLGVLAVVALLAIALPLWLVLTTPRVVHHKAPPVVLSKRVVPKTELPPVEPVELQELSADDARTINATIPFSTLPNPAARPFRLYGAADSQARAVDCLAAAVYYEAGDDAVGERAVAQVILNRLRHPAFPKTVCGVVFQGSERSTGCQFTFTCDGAILRYMPTPTAWERARDVARLALNGSVYRAVGHATHYHTDWVVPYWSASLEKITEVHTHLFFRWAGWWGTPPAFNRDYAGVEPNIGKMARLSPVHQGGGEDAALLGIDNLEGMFVDPASIPASAVPDAMGTEGADTDNFMLTLPKGLPADAFAALAIRTCGERAYCKFMAWADAKQTPAKLPLTSAQVASMSFSYLRDQTNGFAKALWNCQQYKRPSPVQCMRAQLIAPAPMPSGSPTPVAMPEAVRGPEPLGGVRRKGDVPGPEARPVVSFTVPVRPSPTPTAEAR
jgi:spore germination cell wall hydrolase CwlJ-like protein